MVWQLEALRVNKYVSSEPPHVHTFPFFGTKIRRARRPWASLSEQSEGVQGLKEFSAVLISVHRQDTSCVRDHDVKGHTWWLCT